MVSGREMGEGNGVREREMVSGTENESSRKKRIEHGRVETSQTDRFPANEAVEARLKRLDAELARLREETGTPIGLLPH